MEKSPVTWSKNPLLDLAKLPSVLEQQQVAKKEQDFSDTEKIHLIGERGFLLTRPAPILDRIADGVVIS